MNAALAAVDARTTAGLEGVMRRAADLCADLRASTDAARVEGALFRESMRVEGAEFRESMRVENAEFRERMRVENAGFRESMKVQLADQNTRVEVALGKLRSEIASAKIWILTGISAWMLSLLAALAGPPLLRTVEALLTMPAA